MLKNQYINISLYHIIVTWDVWVIQMIWIVSLRGRLDLKIFKAIYGAIIGALQKWSYYSEEEHDLYEKLCYAHMLHAIQNYDPYALYAYYLVAKDKCSPHKLDWDSLLEKIQMESGMNEGDMERGRGLYEGYVRRGSRGYVLPPDDDDDY